MPSAAKKLVIVQNNEAPVPPPDAPATVRPEEMRLLEALLFAAGQPLDEATLARRLPNGVNVKETLAALKAEYAVPTNGVSKQDGLHPNRAGYLAMGGSIDVDALVRDIAAEPSS